jgi:hypothetical protein
VTSGWIEAPHFSRAVLNREMTSRTSTRDVRGGLIEAPQVAQQRAASDRAVTIRRLGGHSDLMLKRRGLEFRKIGYVFTNLFHQIKVTVVFASKLLGPRCVTRSKLPWCLHLSY